MPKRRVKWTASWNVLGSSSQDIRSSCWVIVVLVVMIGCRLPQQWLKQTYLASTLLVWLSLISRESGGLEVVKLGHKSKIRLGRSDPVRAWQESCFMVQSSSHLETVWKASGEPVSSLVKWCIGMRERLGGLESFISEMNKSQLLQTHVTLRFAQQ